MVVVGSLFERRAAGVYHNTAVVFDADGSLRGLYRKMHIPDDPLYYEKYYFTPGDLGFQAFATAVARVGTLVCWDQWYPEAARLTALQGAEILFYPDGDRLAPGREGRVRRGPGQRLGDDAARPRDRQRRLRRGRQPRRPRGPGRRRPRVLGRVVPGRPVRPRSSPAPAATPRRSSIVDCDPKLQEETRRNWPFLRDRRIDAYGPITQRFLDQD